MHLAGISIIGWIHTIGCIAALIFGAMNLVAAKGTPHHKFRGLGYTVSMVVAMGLSLFLYHFDIPVVRGARPGPGLFGLFHWFTVFALFFVLLGYYASSRQGRGLWAYTHPVAMTLSYYLLIGDLINELFARVNVLRPYAVDIINGKPVFPSHIVGITQNADGLAFLIILILFCVKVWRYRRTSAPHAARSARAKSAPAQD
ncbi:MAG TPA: hypothetical protein VKB26_04975 [Candidatus Acidoferrales bacterium]|nr:hypothetical protein [Candidatus Acidoferrales bacterium]